VFGSFNVVPAKRRFGRRRFWFLGGVASVLSRRFVLSIAISVVSIAANSAPAWATFPGTNGRIAFAGIPDVTAATTAGVGDLDIYTMNPNGSGIVNLTETLPEPRFALEPAWSPNGTKIAFRSGRGSAAEIYTVNADGTGLTQLTFNSYKDYAPSWSPDGSKIAFASNRNDPNFATCVGLFAACNIDIFVMPASGGSPVQITFDSDSDQFPRFSPDGKSIAYVSNVSGASAIYAVNLDTLAATKLTPDSLRAGPPDYSPDGTRIAFQNNFYPCTTGSSDCRSDVFVMNANGTSIAQLTHGFRNNGDPTWSPQGDRIAFTHSDSAQFKPQQIYVMNADGTGITRISPITYDSFGPAWGSR
jgi:Tol biopolymer transport system component